LPDLWEILKDVMLDALKTLPFLFLAYLLIEYLENRAGEKTVAAIRGAGPLGPVIGGLLGAVPQCGFSTATANLYAGGVLSRGALLAVFLSTSDEMLPLLISKSAPAGLILKILGFKIVCGIVVGILVDLIEKKIGRSRPKTIEELCEQEGCHCEDDRILKPALIHTVKIFLFLLVSSFVISVLIELIGEDRLAGFILNRPVVGELLAGVLGLIPNCAVSVVLTELYLQGGMSLGALLSGLLVGAGMGVLVLFRINKNVKENLITVAVLFVSGIVLGILGGWMMG